MTNFVKIHCMTAEKLAEFLAQLDCCALADDSSKAVILAWLSSDYKEEVR